MISDYYLSGASLGKVADMLSERRIPSPTGKERWTRAAIDKLFSNAKYIQIVGTEAYMLEKMFPKDNADVLEIRLRDIPGHGKGIASKISHIHQGERTKTISHMRVIAVNENGSCEILEPKGGIKEDMAIWVSFFQCLHGHSLDGVKFPVGNK